ncbi:hypothetical protein N752_24935 [Desulforamulus aquiferis]|nr:hypothetical protein N752_24935 [Desulforamulus aquiferis]
MLNKLVPSGRVMSTLGALGERCTKRILIIPWGTVPGVSGTKRGPMSANRPLAATVNMLLSGSSIVVSITGLVIVPAGKTLRL